MTTERLKHWHVAQTLLLPNMHLAAVVVKLQAVQDDHAEQAHEKRRGLHLADVPDNVLHVSIAVKIAGLKYKSSALM